MNHGIVKTRLGVRLDCYGELKDDSNFVVTCDDEDDDFVWLEGNTDTDTSFKTWQEAADFFEEISSGLVVEIDAI
jgi:hypothetical protein